MTERKKATLTEHALSRKLKARLDKMPGVFAFKIHGGQYQKAGLPDWCITFVGLYGNRLEPRGSDFRSGKTLFVELKSPKGNGKLTELQEATHKRLVASGGEVVVATSVDQVIQSMENMGYGAKL